MVSHQKFWMNYSVMSRERTVFDTNTLISAALFHQSTPRQALDLALATGDLLVAESTILELTSVLLRPKFDRYLSRMSREIFLTTTLRQTYIVAITEQISDCRDARDNKFLEVAVSGGAATIVTGDADLLILNPYRSIRIITARTFLEDRGMLGL